MSTLHSSEPSALASAHSESDRVSGTSEEVSVSVVVPVYRGEQSLPLLVERLSFVLPRIAREYEVLLVNDGSPDQSWSVIRLLGSRHPWVRGINLMRNFGQHNALLCGVRAASMEIVVTMDDDLQHPPEEIHHLMQALVNGADVVYGAPKVPQHGIWRNAASLVTKVALANLMGAESASNVSAFRAFRCEMRDAFSNYQGSYVSLDVLLTWATKQFAVVRVAHEPRKFGVSNYSAKMLVRHALNMIVGFSTLPLRLASMVGFAFTLFGVVVLGYVLLRYFVEGGSIPGFPFLASIVSIFAGAQLFALGIIGEYLARMHTRMEGRPAYVVRHGTNELLSSVGRDDLRP